VFPDAFRVLVIHVPDPLAALLGVAEPAKWHIVGHPVVAKTLLGLSRRLPFNAQTFAPALQSVWIAIPPPAPVPITITS